MTRQPPENPKVFKPTIRVSPIEVCKCGKKYLVPLGCLFCQRKLLTKKKK